MLSAPEGDRELPRPMQPGEIGRAATRDDRPALTSVRNHAQKELDQVLALHLACQLDIDQRRLKGALRP